ncbi:hypothetical protein ACFQY0_16310 [Haloferula chungangensis]|uniref:DUF4168 domain-containing protein n=1 Tax=Haloferula chungangensis TaxID=1048331 RepID=A0ABW2LC44_9BACT
MSSLQTRLLTALLAAAIFTCGVWTGRMTASDPTSKMVFTGESQDRSPSKAADEVLRRYSHALNLSSEQRRATRQLFHETAQKVMSLPPLSPERLAEVENFHNKLEPNLDPSQREIAQKLLERTRKRYNSQGQ